MPGGAICPISGAGLGGGVQYEGRGTVYTSLERNKWGRELEVGLLYSMVSWWPISSILRKGDLGGGLWFACYRINLLI